MRYRYVGSPEIRSQSYQKEYSSKKVTSFHEGKLNVDILVKCKSDMTVTT